MVCEWYAGLTTTTGCGFMVGTTVKVNARSCVYVGGIFQGAYVSTRGWAKVNFHSLLVPREWCRS